jgi:hypothetical protein
MHDATHDISTVASLIIHFDVETWPHASNLLYHNLRLNNYVFSIVEIHL